MSGSNRNNRPLDFLANPLIKQTTNDFLAASFFPDWSKVDSKKSVQSFSMSKKVLNTRLDKKSGHVSKNFHFKLTNTVLFIRMKVVNK